MKRSKCILCLLAMVLVFAAVMSISIFADDGYVSPFKNKEEEAAALKASQEFDAKQEIEINAQKEYEASLTDEERQDLAQAKKDAEEKKYLEDKELGEARYAVLTSQLADFDASHDLENLSEEDNIARIAITDEMLELYQLYITEQPEERTNEVKLLDNIKNGISDCELLLSGLNEKSNAYTDDTPAYKIESTRQEIARTVYRLDHYKELDARYKAGENPDDLWQEHLKWQQNFNAKTDW